jgi:uncharacterized protein YjbI with pentapeptide repeats
LDKDIQAVLTVIGRRNHKFDDQRRWLDLKSVDIRGANLVRSNLTQVDFRGAHLDGGDLRGVNLKEAKLRDASLKRVNLTTEMIERQSGSCSRWGGSLKSYTQTYAYNYTTLEGADLVRADLAGADLEYVNLVGADMRGASFNGANLRGAKLDLADLRGCNLQGGNQPRKGTNFESRRS